MNTQKKHIHRYMFRTPKVAFLRRRDSDWKSKKLIEKCVACGNLQRKMQALRRLCSFEEGTVRRKRFSRKERLGKVFSKGNIDENG